MNNYVCTVPCKYPANRLRQTFNHITTITILFCFSYYLNHAVKPKKKGEPTDFAKNFLFFLFYQNPCWKELESVVNRLRLEIHGLIVNEHSTISLEYTIKDGLTELPIVSTGKGGFFTIAVISKAVRRFQSVAIFFHITSLRNLSKFSIHFLPRLFTWNSNLRHTFKNCSSYDSFQSLMNLAENWVVM